MSQKKQSVIDRLSELAIALVVEEAVRRSRERIYRFFRKIILAFGISVVGLVCLLIGFVYTTLGVVKLVEVVIPGWAAFIVIGIVLLGAGYAMIRLAFR